MPPAAIRTSEKIRVEIECFFGFVPTFFEPAFEHPAILQNLWENTRLSYLENPLPPLFKEKLAALLARFCSVNYCLIAHSCWLRELGMKSSEIYELLDQDALDFDSIGENIKWLGNRSLEEWPSAGSQVEAGLLSSCVSIFIDHDVTRVYAKLRRVLGEKWYAPLIEFISWNRTALNWMEAHPEILFEEDERVKRHFAAMIAEEPRLQTYFASYRERMSEKIDRVKLSPVGETKKLVVREKQTSERLRTVLTRLEHVANGLNLGYLSCDLITLDLRVDEAFREHFAFPSGVQFEARTIAQYLDESVREKALEKCREAIATGAILKLKLNSIYMIAWATYDSDNRPQFFEIVSFDAEQVPDHKFGSAISMG